MSYQEKILQVIMEAHLDEFDEPTIPLRFLALMQGQGIFSLSEVFETYPDRTSLLRSKNMRRKTIDQFIEVLKSLEERHGIHFEWLEKLGSAFRIS